MFLHSPLGPRFFAVTTRLLPKTPNCFFHSSFPSYAGRRSPSDVIENPFAVLGVSEDATDEEIRNAHRALAKKYHPDVCKLPDANEKFVQIQKAYTMIKNEEARANTKINTSMSEEFTVEVKNLGPEERFILTMLSERLKAGKQIIGSVFVPPIGIYQVSRFRKDADLQLYNFENLSSVFPHFLTIAEDVFHASKDVISFLVFSRYSDQHGLASISYSPKTKRMEWLNQQDKLIAYATVNNSTKRGLTKSTISVHSSQGKLLGSIDHSYYAKFPIFSRLQITGANGTKNLVANRHAILGTHLSWELQGIAGKSAAQMHRNLVSPLGRIFYVDIGTHHSDLHPAFYLFSLLHVHFVDLLFSPVRPVARMLWGYLNSSSNSQDE